MQSLHDAAFKASSKSTGILCASVQQAGLSVVYFYREHALSALLEVEGCTSAAASCWGSRSLSLGDLPSLAAAAAAAHASACLVRSTASAAAAAAAAAALSAAASPPASGSMGTSSSPGTASWPVTEAADSTATSWPALACRDGASAALVSCPRTEESSPAQHGNEVAAGARGCCLQPQTTCRTTLQASMSCAERLPKHRVRTGCHQQADHTGYTGAVSFRQMHTDSSPSSCWLGMGATDA